MVGPREVGLAGPQQRDDDLERLLEAVVDVILGQAERMRTAPGVAGTEPQDEPAAADLIDGRGRLGDDPRVAVEADESPRCRP